MSAPRRTVRPFPWRSLESLTSADVAIERDIRRACASSLRLEAVARAASELLGTDVEFLFRRAAHGPSPRPIDDAVTLRLDLFGREASPCVVSVEASLAAIVVARALRRQPPRMLNRPPSVSPALAGAFGAIVQAIVRRAHAGFAWSVAPAGEGADAVPGRADVDFTVLLDDEAYAARVVVAADRTAGGEADPFAAPALRRLGDLPLAIPLVAHALHLTSTELATLRAGDALVFGNWPMTCAARGKLCGTGWLSAPAADWGIRVRLGEDGTLVLGGEAGTLVSMAPDLPETTSNAALVDAVGDVPVIVKVEIGEARMTAREWASISPGDVVTLGRKIGETVVLRVGGIPVARGELVDVDGEIGVRISERMTSLGATT